MSLPIHNGKDTPMVPDSSRRREHPPREPQWWFALITMLASLARLVIDATRH